MVTSRQQQQYRRMTTRSMSSSLLSSSRIEFTSGMSRKSPAQLHTANKQHFTDIPKTATTATTKKRKGSSETTTTTNPSRPRAVKPKPAGKNNTSTSKTKFIIQNLVSAYVRDHNISVDVNNNSEEGLRTKNGWCLLKGLTHIASVHDGILLPVIEKFGPPKFYFDAVSSSSSSCRHVEGENIKSTVSNGKKDTYDTFRSLCRIIAGQQLAGSAAIAVWTRLLNVANGSTPDNPYNLTPSFILSIADSKEKDAIEIKLRKPAGLSNAKVKAIIDLARHYHKGDLSDSFLLDKDNDEETIRNRLLKVKGIGPWSCDMFLLFHVHKADLLPLGDLGVRKGTGKLFNVQGKKGKNGKAGVLCEKKDGELLTSLHEPFKPFRSLSTYYMWKCADTVDFNDNEKKKK